MAFALAGIRFPALRTSRFSARFSFGGRQRCGVLISFPGPAKLRFSLVAETGNVLVPGTESDDVQSTTSLPVPDTESDDVQSTTSVLVPDTEIDEVQSSTSTLSNLQLLQETDDLTIEDKVESVAKGISISTEIIGEESMDEAIEVSVSSQSKEAIEVEEKPRIVPPPGTGQRIYEIDPSLKDFRGHLDYRYSQYKKMREMIDQYEGGLDAFSRGYEKFGFQCSSNGITYREWAPGAKSATLIGDFNNWNPEANVMKRDEYGVWEVFLPNNPDGASPIPHGSRVKDKRLGKTTSNQELRQSTCRICDDDLVYGLSSHEGFRKIDADKWEFATDYFVRGNKSSLRNINRRRSSQIHQIASQVSSSAEPYSSGLEGEIHVLKSDRNALMQEIIRLQQENVATVQQMDSLKLQMQSAEQRQKQLVSFLAKVLQNPEFLVHLRQQKKSSLIASPRVKRKFLKHTPSSGADPLGSVNQGLESRLGSAEASSSSALQDPESLIKKEFPDNMLSGLVEKLGLEADAEQLVEVLEQTEDDTLAPLFLDDRIMLSMETYSADYAEVNPDSCQYFPSLSQGINIAETSCDAIVTATERTLPDVESLQFNKRNVIASGTGTTSGASEFLVSFPDLPFKEKTSAEEPTKETILEQEEEWEAVLEAGQRSFTYEENVWDATIQDPGMPESFDMPWDLVLQTPDDNLEKGDAVARFLSLECGDQSAPSENTEP